MAVAEWNRFVWEEWEERRDREFNGFSRGEEREEIEFYGLINGIWMEKCDRVIYVRWYEKSKSTLYKQKYSKFYKWI